MDYLIRSFRIRIGFVLFCLSFYVQPIADILLWDCDNHLKKEDGKRLFRMGQGNMGQGNTKTYLKQLFEYINECSKYGRNMVNQLCENTLDREVWMNIIKQVSFAQKTKHETNNNTITSTITINTSNIA